MIRATQLSAVILCLILPVGLIGQTNATVTWGDPIELDQHCWYSEFLNVDNEYVFHVVGRRLINYIISYDSQAKLINKYEFEQKRDEAKAYIKQNSSFVEDGLIIRSVVKEKKDFKVYESKYDLKGKSLYQNKELAVGRLDVFIPKTFGPLNLFANPDGFLDVSYWAHGSIVLAENEEGDMLSIILYDSLMNKIDAHSIHLRSKDYYLKYTVRENGRVTLFLKEYLKRNKNPKYLVYSFRGKDSSVVAFDSWQGSASVNWNWYPVNDSIIAYLAFVENARKRPGKQELLGIRFKLINYIKGDIIEDRQQFSDVLRNDIQGFFSQKGLRNDEEIRPKVVKFFYDTQTSSYYMELSLYSEIEDNDPESTWWGYTLGYQYYYAYVCKFDSAFNMQWFKKIPINQTAAINNKRDERFRGFESFHVNGKYYLFYNIDDEEREWHRKYKYRPAGRYHREGMYVMNVIDEYGNLDEEVLIKYRPKLDYYVMRIMKNKDYDNIILIGKKDKKFRIGRLELNLE